MSNTTKYDFSHANDTTLNIRMRSHVADKIRKIATQEKTTIQEVCRVFLENALADYVKYKNNEILDAELKKGVFMSNTTDWLDEILHNVAEGCWWVSFARKAILDHYKDLENNARIDELKMLQKSDDDKAYTDYEFRGYIVKRLYEFEQLQSKKEKL